MNDITYRYDRYSLLLLITINSIFHFPPAKYQITQLNKKSLKIPFVSAAHRDFYSTMMSSLFFFLATGCLLIKTIMKITKFVKTEQVFFKNGFECE